MGLELVTPKALGPSLAPIEERNAPEVLYTAGDKRLLAEGSLIAIVGSRKASENGIKGGLFGVQKPAKNFHENPLRLAYLLFTALYIVRKIKIDWREHEVKISSNSSL